MMPLLLMGCGSDEEVLQAVGELGVVEDVKECEDTGETELNPANGEELDVYLCTVKVPGVVDTELERAALEAGIDASKESGYLERCFTIGQIDDELVADITVDVPEGCPPSPY